MREYGMALVGGAMMAQRFGQLCTWVLSTSLGSIGIIFLLASFSMPHFGLNAFICLGSATAICWALD